MSVLTRRPATPAVLGLCTPARVWKSSDYRLRCPDPCGSGGGACSPSQKSPFPCQGTGLGCCWSWWGTEERQSMDDLSLSFSSPSLKKKHLKKKEKDYPGPILFTFLHTYVMKNLNSPGGTALLVTTQSDGVGSQVRDVQEAIKECINKWNNNSMFPAYALSNQFLKIKEKKFKHPPLRNTCSLYKNEKIRKIGTCRWAKRKGNRSDPNPWK